MPFWPVVIAVLVGVPALLLFSGMAMIFAAAGLAGGPQESRATTVVYAWLAIAWALVGTFGAFGLEPAWRAWHGGDESFDGGLPLFVDWLAGVGAVGLVAAFVVRVMAAAGPGDDRRSPLSFLARWLLLALGLAPWAALIAWIAWPLALWPVRGRFEWPDAATGWTRTGVLTAILVAAAVVEDVVRKASRR